MQHMSIDIETFSSVDIKASGMYKYAQSPDFEVLLFACSIDGGSVVCLDLTEGPLPEDILALLRSPSCIKHAANAAFEWYCLGRHLGLSEEELRAWLPQWRDTLLHSLYCGYPASLEATGQALGLEQEQQKLSTGRALIRYFCVPCKPTKTNGWRSQNLPHHAPEKWKLFQGYNIQDVVAEMEIEKRLQSFPVPEEIQRQWELDQCINLRGVAVDMELVQSALWCGETAVAELKAEAQRITGLENPNSVPQLTKWLTNETGEDITDLRKSTVSDLLERGLSSERAARMLELRQKLGKTSTAKYDAIEACVGEDGRVRGLLQFYGANRTGREAGRLVQIQNLPRTFLKALPVARMLTKERNLAGLRLCYGSVPHTLLELIRTAFVAGPGKVLLDADFSAIEARIIAWLAGEEWALEVFRTTGKIYEATAAQMFHVPEESIRKGRENYGLRQKGKVATLALGYQGGPAALKAMRETYAIPEEDLPDQELPDIVSRWRNANPNIAQFWYNVEDAALQAVTKGRKGIVGNLVFAREIDPVNGQDFLTIRLPSGRKLYYAKPHLGLNHFGRQGLCFYGMNQTTRKWEVVETYGGRLAENITQAIALAQNKSEPQG